MVEGVANKHQESRIGRRPLRGGNHWLYLIRQTEQCQSRYDDISDARAKG